MDAVRGKGVLAVEQSSDLRVRLLRLSGVMLVVGLALSAGVVAWIAYVLHGLTTDIATSQSSVPSAVTRVLPTGTDILDHPQVIMVRYSSGVSRTAAVLVSTVPDRRLVAFLTLPPSTSLGTSEPLGSYSTPDAIKALKSDRITVTHVALIQPQKIAPLVDALGGVTVHNPLDFTVQTKLGANVHFPRGEDRLDGQRAALYVEAATTNEHLETASAALLAGVVRGMVTDVPVGRIRGIADAMAGSVSSDLSDADVLGLVEMRLRGGELLQCRAFRGEPLTEAANQQAIERFLGVPGATGGRCTARHVNATTGAPPTAIVNVVRHYGWKLFGVLALMLSTFALVAAGVLVTHWPRPVRRPQASPPPPLTWPPSGA
jgi:cell envelope-related transcriptional attenuator-like protein